jgi:hypothetical protein
MNFHGLELLHTRVSIIKVCSVCSTPNNASYSPRCYAPRMPEESLLYLKDAIQAILPSKSARGNFFPKESRPSWDRFFARIVIATTATTPTINPKNTSRSHLLPFPIETIREASYECHEDVPRWWKRGVTTSPFKLCNLGLSFGPARIFRSARFVWRVWMDLLQD